MRKKLIFVFGLILFLGLGLFLANQAQTKEIASFEGDNLNQIEAAVLREGPTGGWPVLVDDHLRVTGFFYPDQGIVTGKSGGDPVIIGDHMRVDGFLHANSGIVRGVSGGDPVIIADHLRVDGEISRPFGPVRIKDNLEVTGDVKITGDIDPVNINLSGEFSIEGKPEPMIDSSGDLTVDGNTSLHGQVNVLHNVSEEAEFTLFDVRLINNTTGGFAQNIFRVVNPYSSTGGQTESLVWLYNEDQEMAVVDGLLMQSEAGGITDGVDVSDTNITNAINIGGNAIAGTNFNVTAAGAITSTGLDAGSGTIQTTGKLIIPNGTSTPVTCIVGELFLDTDGPTNYLYGCTAIDTWTAL